MADDFGFAFVIIIILLIVLCGGGLVCTLVDESKAEYTYEECICEIVDITIEEGEGKIYTVMDGVTYVFAVPSYAAENMNIGDEIVVVTTFRNGQKQRPKIDFKNQKK